MSLWPSCQTSDASGASVTLPAPEVEAGEVLFSSTSSYSVLEFIVEGCFGRVARCQRLETEETVGVKILKDLYDVKDKEVFMLEHISVLNPDETNIVKFFERFDHMGQTCLAFEMLDRSLYDLLKEQRGKPLSVKEVRPIAQQVLVALDALKGLGVLHTDIKPDNIMLVNQQDQPFRVKLIDFGEAISVTNVRPAGYRYLHLSSDEEHSLFSDEDLAMWTFHRVHPPWLNDGDPAAGSSDRDKTTDSTSAASASSS